MKETALWDDKDYEPISLTSRTLKALVRILLIVEIELNFYNAHCKVSPLAKPSIRDKSTTDLLDYGTVDINYRFWAASEGLSEGRREQ